MPVNIHRGFVLALLAALSTPALAHHSFQGEFDASKPINPTDVVTKFVGKDQRK